MAGFEQPAMLAAGLLALAPLYVFFRQKEDINKVVGVAKALTVLLLAVGAAQPFVQSETSVSEEPTVKVLSDESSSAQLLERSGFDPEGIDVETRTIASGNSSDLRTSLLQSLEQDTAYVAISDMRSEESLQGVADRFNQKNSSLSVLKYDTKPDSSVTVRGPSTTVPGAENRFVVETHSTRDAPEPRVVLDGEQVGLTREGDSTWSFSQEFSETGSHTIRAAIESDDTYDNNNRYFKTVEVVEKPKMLFLGESGELGERLSRFYEVEYRQSVPDDLESYYAVVASEEFESSELEGYVARGNGLIYTGGLETDNRLLPVRKTDRSSDTESAKIMLAVDISVSTGESGVKMSKKIAYNLVEELPGSSKVGVVAYNSEAYLVNEPEILATNRDKLKSKIARLENGGPSEHHRGVQGAQEALNGTGNIIFISDGRAPDTTINGRTIENRADEKGIDAASRLGEVRLISVGVGEDRNEDFLRELALRGSGRYVDARDADRLRFEFSAGGAAAGTSRLKKVRDHFITRDLELDSQVASFDPAEPKPGGKLLVAGRGGSPFLTTWRYGIGRVAAFTGDDSQLSQTLDEDPALVSRTVSWAAGSPKRKQDRWLEARDARRPDEVSIRASYDAEGLRRQGEELYTTSLEPESGGFGEFDGKQYAYSYNPEYEEIGYAPDMRDFVRETGGQVYTANETAELKQDIKTFSRKETVQKRKLGSFFIAAALLVFLAEVGYRKVKGKK